MENIARHLRIEESSDTLFHTVAQKKKKKKPSLADKLPAICEGSPAPLGADRQVSHLPSPSCRLGHDAEKLKQLIQEKLRGAKR